MNAQHRKTDCVLCRSEGEEVLWQDDRCRVIRVGGEEGAAFPGFCRVIWQEHIQEMSDLPASDRTRLLHVLTAVELALRHTARPDKINLAALGNMVPHLHWHVIPRWRDDSHFPAAIWAEAQRPVPVRTGVSSADLRATLTRTLAELENGN